VGEKKKKKKGNGNRGRERKKLRKKRYFGSCEKNKYIKKWNSKVKIGSLV
jgi:hypothetical protein